MKVKVRRSLNLTVASICGLGLTLGLAACSIDSAVWGAEGAAVRDAAQQFVKANIAGASPEVCESATADLGISSEWAGLEVGEPAKFAEEQWEAYKDLAPTWVINLSYAPSEGGVESKRIPSFLFFQGDRKNLCVVAVEWGDLVPTR